MTMKDEHLSPGFGHSRIFVAVIAIVLSSASLTGVVTPGNALDRQHPTESEERRNRSAQFFADRAKSAFGAGRYDEAVDAVPDLRCKWMANPPHSGAHACYVAAGDRVRRIVATL
ncbi:hypothetical protein HYPDE_23518 [Hyphomicrobium denitrificans 1NES1]|uniref:Uncharacterized protein n=1 Tax=Hyphomicrobium denitrificans 1NES1 TaxID=670307 RepID=N0B8K5_9HYPH|nr:hypothetical protein [Hyphomicrobium denitrificans]AGK56390.1 hypothetical protein HYPDE_23518 [Hyphomicrobium denitrificans 1NES1]